MANLQEFDDETLGGMSNGDLRELAKNNNVNISGLRSNAELATAIGAARDDPNHDPNPVTPPNPDFEDVTTVDPELNPSPNTILGADGILARDAEPDEGKPQKGDVHIHLVDDGLTLLGQVWYKGQELIISEASVDATRGSDGKTVLDIRNDDRAQIRRFGRVLFHEGPWPLDPSPEPAVENNRIVRL